MVARRRGLRRKRFHLSGIEALDERDRIRRLVQHEPEQVASGEFRLFLHVGALQDAPDPRPCRGSIVPPTRKFRRIHRLPSLGNPLESPLQVAQALVRHPQVRNFRPAEVHPQPHQIGQTLRVPRQSRFEVRSGQRRQIGSGLFPLDPAGSPEPEPPGQHQRFRQAPHDPFDGQGEVHNPLLRRGGTRQRNGYRARLERDRGTRDRTAGVAGRAEGEGGADQAAADAAEVEEVLLHEKRLQGAVQEVAEQVEPLRRRYAYSDPGRGDGQSEQRERAG